MEENFTGKEVYRQNFVPQDYLKTYYSLNSANQEDANVVMFTLKNLHKIFSGDGIKGDTLIDVGGGPCVHQYISACEAFREIIATDYTEQNRQELLRWLRKEPGAFDWSPVAKYVCELEGDREKWVEKEEKVRRTVRRVLKCDVTQANPLAPLEVPQACCVTSLLCLEVACQDLPTYRQAMKSVGSLVKPGGHLVMLVALKDSFYVVGQHRFSCLHLEQETVNSAVREAGFEVKWSELSTVQWSQAVADSSGIYTLVAQKRRAQQV